MKVAENGVLEPSSFRDFWDALDDCRAVTTADLVRAARGRKEEAGESVQ